MQPVIFNRVGALGLVACIFALLACTGDETADAFAAFQACQQTLSTATDLKTVECLDAAALPEGIDPQTMLEHWQGLAAIPWELARGSVEGSEAKLRLMPTDDPKPNEGYTAEMVNSDGRWLLKGVGIKVVDFMGGSEFGTGTMQMRTPKTVRSDHVVTGVTRAGNNVGYGLHDLWGEAAVEIQSKRGPLTVGKIEYEYLREAFSEPPVEVTIRLGIYDEQRFSYKHGGEISVDNEADGLLSGSYRLWAEKRDGERVELSGTFEDLPADGKDLFGG